jgi:signal recognition particle subunit SRP54
MVLADLGSKISNALRNVAKTANINDIVIRDMLNEICAGLMAADVNTKQVVKLKNNIKSKLNLEELKGVNKRNYINKVVFGELVALLDPGIVPFKPVKNKTNVVMFVGLQGSGKTTTCTKYAYYYKKKGFRVALVCADTFRAGAFDQLRQNATKVGIPFFGSYIETDPVKLAKDGVDQFKSEKFDLIIVDTSGRHKQEASLFEEMEQVQVAVQPNDVVFVMDSSIGQAATDQAAAFKSKVAVGSVIVTKLDGHAKGGGAMSAVAATKSPITFIGTGESFEEFQEFEAQSFVSRLLGMGDIKQLMDVVTNAIDMEKQPKMWEHLSQGVYTMRDMYEHFTSIMKMGPLSQVMSMIPGFSEQLITKGHEKEGQAKIKQYLTIMDSMNNDELDHPKLLEMSQLPSRVRRIARGSGASIQAVNELLSQFKLFQKMIGQMSNLNLQNIKSPKDLQKLQKNLPQALKGMPGMGNMDMGSMMKQMQSMMKGGGNPMGGGGGMGGMGGLANLAKMFGGQ